MLQHSKVIQFGLHDGNLTLSVTELVAQKIHFFRCFVELDIGQAVIKRLASLEALLGEGVAQVLCVNTGCLFESGVIHQINLTNTLIFEGKVKHHARGIISVTHERKAYLIISDGPFNTALHLMLIS